MDEIYSRIKIIPLKQCLVHEGIVQKWVGDIASNIKSDGLMRNPVVVTKHNQYYVVLDGMHRYAALQQMEIRDILACEVDYFSEQIILEGWDAFLFEKVGAKKLLGELFSEKEGYSCERAKDLRHAQAQVMARQSLLAVGDRGGDILLLNKKGVGEKEKLDVLCAAVDKVDRTVSQKFSKLIYVDNSLTLANFESSGATSVIFRPQFTKQEVIDRTLNKKIFPPKSTRHLIPERPLHVDLDLSMLRADIDLKTKNKLLQDHLKWCYENNRVRFYPESVYVFAD